MSEIRTRTIQGLQSGDTFTISRRFTEEDMMTFANVTRDYNAVHLDSRFSGAKKFKDRICHGLLVGSMLTAFELVAYCKDNKRITCSWAAG